MLKRADLRRRAEDGVVFIGSGDGQLYALDRATGAERWRHQAGRRILSSPVLAARRGTGFVRLFGGTWSPGGTTVNFSVVQAVADYLPR